MTDLDELVAAVVRKLPAPGKPFPAEQREAWLKMMAMAFDVSYGPGDNVLPFPARPTVVPNTTASGITVHLGLPRYYISKDGRALKDAGSFTIPVRAVDVPRDEVIYDERPEGHRDLDTIIWADGTWPAEALPPLTLAG